MTDQQLAIVPRAVEMVVLPPERDQGADFGRQWLGAMLASDEWMQRQWDKLRDEWLRAKWEKSKSAHTERNYRRVLHRWADFVSMQRTADGLPLKLWQVETRHVREWQRQLYEEDLSEVTVNHHLSSVSSFYSFVIAEKFMVQGQEVCMFVDATGAARANPFKYGNVQRSKVEQYERAMPMDKEDLGKLVRYVESKQHSLGGARNYALVLTYLLTGWRNHEVLRMQWKHIRSNKSQKGSMVYAWQGKGGKKSDEPIPQDAWYAIVAYLKADGRWTPGIEPIEQPLDPDEYIFRAVVTHTLGRLKGVQEKLEDRAQNGAISEKSALRIVRTALKNAGVKHWQKFRVHDLRHTFAREMKESGASETEVMQMLHHSNLATTGLYLKRIIKKGEDRVDVRTQQLYQQMKLY